MNESTDDENVRAPGPTSPGGRSPEEAQANAIIAGVCCFHLITFFLTSRDKYGFRLTWTRGKRWRQNFPAQTTGSVFFPTFLRLSQFLLKLQVYMALEKCSACPVTSRNMVHLAKWTKSCSTPKKVQRPVMACIDYARLVDYTRLGWISLGSVRLG